MFVDLLVCIFVLMKMKLLKCLVGFYRILWVNLWWVCVNFAIGGLFCMICGWLLINCLKTNPPTHHHQRCNTIKTTLQSQPDPSSLSATNTFSLHKTTVCSNNTPTSPLFFFWQKLHHSYQPFHPKQQTLITHLFPKSWFCRA